MALAISRVKRWGNSLGIIISRETVDHMNLKEGEEVSIDIVDKRKIDGFGICKNSKPFNRDQCLLDR